MSKRRRCLVAAATVLVCLSLAACGDTDRPDNSLPSSPSETSTPVEDTTTSMTDASSAGPTTTTVQDPSTTTTRPPLTITTRPPRTTTTEAPITTEATTATTETPATEAAVGPTEPTDDDTMWWPWVFAGVAIIGLVAFLIARSRKAERWQQQVAASLDESTRLATHLAAVTPDGARMVAPQDAAQLASLAATLTALGEQAKDEAHRTAIEALRDQAHVLHGVVDGIAMGATPATDTTLAYLREQAAALHAVTARARAAVLPSPATAAGSA
jgi:hypothetical protein